MKYIAINELNHFQFHDAEIKEIIQVNNDMIWTAFFINAMTTNTQNNNQKDMQMGSAVLTFTDVAIDKLEFSEYISYHSKTAVTETHEAIIVLPNEYNRVFSESTSEVCYIYGMDGIDEISENRYRCCFNIHSQRIGVYRLIFTFTTSIVEWDEYCGEAWYEHTKWKK